MLEFKNEETETAFKKAVQIGQFEEINPPSHYGTDFIATTRRFKDGKCVWVFIERIKGR